VDQIGSPGEIVGLSYVVKEWRHQSAASAVERTELLRLKRESFQKLFDAEDMAAYRLVDRLAEEVVQEMRDANRRLHEVFGNPAETLRNLRRRVRQA
jgi:CRP/FNR family transcriptional regulator, cyclic AMP receptor protein